MQSKKRLSDYKEPNYYMDNVDIYFDIRDEFTNVCCKTELSPRAKASNTLDLDAKDLELVSVLLDDKLLKEGSDYEINPEGMRLLNLNDNHQLEINTKIYPHKNKSLEGLYKTSDFYCTQNEAEGFRRISYFLDRPDNLASYTCHIEADKTKYPVLLSNGDLIESKDIGENRCLKTWKDPFKKPCYLFALVAGDLKKISDTYTTGSGREIKLEIYSEEKYLNRLAYSMEALKDSMKWDEDRFSLEYDLNTYMIVASDDFNSGAMENKGLNIFNTKFVLASPETATEENYYLIQSVVGHEYFHNWSGNRVTCRDWFQLSLKEGLTVFRDQEFTSDLNSRAVKRIEDVTNLRRSQLTEDAGPNAHPVRPEEVMSIDNFYSPTIYEKGAELIRMVHTILGEKKFQKALSLYFKKFDGTAATCDDFIATMEESSNYDFSHFKLWYSQSGTPQLNIDDTWNEASKTFKINLSQLTKPTNDQKEKKALYIPIRLDFFGQDGSAISPVNSSDLIRTEHSDFLFILDKEKAEIELAFDSKPIASYLRSFSAPCILNKHYSSDDLAFLAKNDTDLFNRYEAVSKILKSELLARYEGQETKLDIDVLKNTLSEYSNDPSFVELCLRMPSLDYFSLSKKEWDFDKLITAYTSLENDIAIKLKEEFLASYRELEEETRGMTGLKYKGMKSLSGLCLRYIALSDQNLLSELALNQIKNNNDMTKQLSALNAIRNKNNFTPEDILFRNFKNKWGSDKLVFNNYLSLVCGEGKNIKKQWIEECLKSEYFDSQNPNNLYNSCFRFISNFNLFHANYDWSYEWALEKIQEIDKFNSQVAGRLAGGIDNWNKLGGDRKNKMANQLSELSKKELSPNLREIIENNLKLLEQ